MELSKEAGTQKEKFKVKVTPSDLPETEKERRLFEVFDVLFAPSRASKKGNIKLGVNKPQT
jgi:hypothetical protein